jgi:hypothetical protein
LGQPNKFLACSGGDVPGTALFAYDDEALAVPRADGDDDRGTGGGAATKGRFRKLLKQAVDALVLSEAECADVVRESAEVFRRNNAVVGAMDVGGRRWLAVFLALLATALAALAWWWSADATAHAASAGSAAAMQVAGLRGLREAGRAASDSGEL